MSAALRAAAARDVHGTAGAPGRSRFFAGMSALLLAIVLVGFSRTLYLRWALGLPALPAHVYLHGVVLTSWFVLAFAQACLVATRRTSLHRRLGVAGVVLAGGVVGVSLLTLLRFVSRGEFPDLAPMLAFGNLASLIGFSICVACGAALRHRPDAHKRFMLLASIAIVGPALDRFARVPAFAPGFRRVFSITPMPFYLFFAAIGVVVLLLVPLAHDLRSRGRPHPATLWGILSILFLAQALGAALAFGGPWDALVPATG
jgi:hypothetical protein